MVRTQYLAAAATVLVLVRMPELTASVLNNIAAIEVLARVARMQAAGALAVVRPCVRWHASLTEQEPGGFRDEEALYAAALRFDDTSGAAKRSLARLYLLRQDVAHALSVLDEVVRVDARDVLSRLWLGEMQWETGQKTAAGNTWRRLTSFDEALKWHGARAQQLGQLDDALVCYEKLLELNDSDPETLVGMGRVLALQHRPTEALAYIDRAVAVRPEGSGELPGAFRAEQLLLLGRPAEAFQACKAVYESGVKDSFALWICGNVAMATQRDPMWAKRFWVKALAVNPMHLDLYVELVKLARRVGHEAEAVEWCGRAAKLFPHEPRIDACRQPTTDLDKNLRERKGSLR